MCDLLQTLRDALSPVSTVFTILGHPFYLLLLYINALAHTSTCFDPHGKLQGTNIDCLKAPLVFFVSSRVLWLLAFKFIASQQTAFAALQAYGRWNLPNVLLAPACAHILFSRHSAEEHDLLLLAWCCCIGIVCFFSTLSISSITGRSASDAVFSVLILPPVLVSLTVVTALIGVAAGVASTSEDVDLPWEQIVVEVAREFSRMVILLYTELIQAMDASLTSYLNFLSDALNKPTMAMRDDIKVFLPIVVLQTLFEGLSFLFCTACLSSPPTEKSSCPHEKPRRQNSDLGDFSRATHRAQAKSMHISSTARRRHQSRGGARLDETSNISDDDKHTLSSAPSSVGDVSDGEWEVEDSSTYSKHTVRSAHTSGPPSRTRTSSSKKSTRGKKGKSASRNSSSSGGGGETTACVLAQAADVTFMEVLMDLAESGQLDEVNEMLDKVVAGELNRKDFSNCKCDQCQEVTVQSDVFKQIRHNKQDILDALTLPDDVEEADSELAPSSSGSPSRSVSHSRTSTMSTDEKKTTLKQVVSYLNDVIESGDSKLAFRAAMDKRRLYLETDNVWSDPDEVSEMSS